MSVQPDPKHVITGRVRFSYAHVFSPHQRSGQDPKYSVTLLIPKSDVATKQKIDYAIEAAAQEGVQKKFGGVRPPLLAIPIHDGDSVKPSDGMPFGKECKGHWVMTASAPVTRKPEVVDAFCQPIINQSEFYSGCYGRASIRFFAYVNAGKKGIGCGLNNVQKFEDGETLAGGTTAMEDFGSGGFTPTQPLYPQPGYGTPVQPMQPNYAMPVQPTAPNYAVPAQAPAPAINPITGLPTAPAIDPITGRPAIGRVLGM